MRKKNSVCFLLGKKLFPWETETFNPFFVTYENNADEY